MFKKIITKIIIAEARFAIRKHAPKVIGITGSVGKTSTKELIRCLLEARYVVRSSPASYNSEIGIALSILGLRTPYRSIFGWLRVLIEGWVEMRNKKFPEVVVLEMGIDRPKDLEKILRVAKPDIAVVTAIGAIPVHVEFFAGPEEVAREKSKILKALTAQGMAILNFDDDVVWSMREKTSAQIASYGFGEHADFRASNEKVSFSGTTFKMDHAGSSVPIHLKNALGKHNIYSALAAAAVGDALGFNVIEISQHLSLCSFPPGRMRLVRGIKQSTIIDDTYNSSPLALRAALETLGELDAPRKIAVVGDMLEIGKYTIEAHRAVGEYAHNIVDVLITIGPRSKFAADEAIAMGMSKKNVESFSTADEAKEYVAKHIQEKDLILVKGSQAMRMERIVEEIMAEPDRAQELLVRQDTYWRNKK